MLTGGHVAVSYLVAESARHFGLPLTNTEVLGIVIAGNIVDLDFLLGFLNGKTGEAHHQNITHTPIGVFSIWLGIDLLFHPFLYLSLSLLVIMMIHLVLDDIGYWAYKAKLYKSAVNPQINWLYPLTKFHTDQLMKNNKAGLLLRNKDVLKYYLFNTWPIFLLEIILIVTALVVFLSLNFFNN